jgi:hypothetical protein
MSGGKLAKTNEIEIAFAILRRKYHKTRNQCD